MPAYEEPPVLPGGSFLMQNAKRGITLLFVLAVCQTELFPHMIIGKYFPVKMTKSKWKSIADL